MIVLKKCLSFHKYIFIFKLDCTNFINFYRNLKKPQGNTENENFKRQLSRIYFTLFFSQTYSDIFEINK